MHDLGSRVAKYQNGENIQNNHKIYKMATKCTKCPPKILNDRKIDQWRAIKYIHM
jgi:hypothetical protein